MKRRIITLFLSLTLIGATMLTGCGEQGAVSGQGAAIYEKAEAVAGDIFVAPDGAGDGSSADSPMDFAEALTKVSAGNTIWMAAGIYEYSSSIVIAENNAGREGAYKSVKSYGGEAVLDFSGMGYSGSDADTKNRGVVLDGSYWHFYGVRFKEAADNGMLLSGDNNIIELCVFEGNHDTGLQISRYQGKYETIPEWPTNNLVKNCTSFNNIDIEGENADGFAAKLTCGEGNVFDGCLAYNNSDDGWDLYAKDTTGPIGTVTIKNCIAFRNGKLTTGEGTAQGDMNGFKLGGKGVGTPHIIINCMAFENGAHGFTDNNNPTAITLQNCTSVNNGIYKEKKANFQMNRESGGINTNLLSYNTAVIATDNFIGTIAHSVYYHNAPDYYWVSDATAINAGDKLGVKTSIKETDFVTVNVPEATSDFHRIWRNADGSLNTGGVFEVADDSEYAKKADDGGKIGAQY